MRNKMIKIKSQAGNSDNPIDFGECIIKVYYTIKVVSLDDKRGASGNYKIIENLFRKRP